MKPVVNDKKCGAVESACKAIKVCPTQAIRYIEVDEAILDRDVNCVTGECGDGASCDCDCEDGGSCNGSPYGRIVIDYDKCIDCGLCIEACCGSAIVMADKSDNTDSKAKAKNGCCCNGKC